jgi:hypothetical protein
MEDFATRSNGVDQSDCPYSPGQLVSESGVYEICHYDEPRTSIILTLSGIFPSCRICGEKVRYKLVKAVPHISEDPDFMESASTIGELHSGMIVQQQNPPVQLGWNHGFRFWQDTTQSGREGSEARNL